jgi:hypothetical protein
MRALHRNHDISVSLREGLDDILPQLAETKNVGQGLTINDVRYENLGSHKLPYVPSDARTVVSARFLDEEGVGNSNVWGINAVYATLADLLVLAQQQKVALKLDHPVSEYAQALPYKDVDRTRLLQTTSLLPETENQALTRLLKPNFSVVEEAMAVQALISSLNASLFEAYKDDMWPQLDPAEVAAFHGSMTYAQLHENFQRSQERLQLFGPAPKRKPTRSTR